MSYNAPPPPDPNSAVFRIRVWVETQIRDHTVRYWLILWILAAASYAMFFGTDPAENAKRAVADRLVGAFAWFGWIVPLVLFVRQRQSPKTSETEE